jgi:hypothetical protein
MPAIFPHYDVKDKRLNEAGITEIRSRKKLIDKYWDYYYGIQEPSLKIGQGGIDYNVTINVSSQAIDKMVSFFVPTSPKIIIKGGIDREKQGDTLIEMRTPQQEALDSFWSDNQLDDLVLDIALSGFITGHTFMRLIMPTLAGELPGIGLIDARNIVTFWDITKTDRRLFYRLIWQLDSLGNEQRVQDIVPIWLLTHEEGMPIVEDFSEGWMIFEYKRGAQNSLELIDLDRWPFEFPPIIDWKNSQAPFLYYGQSDLKHRKLNDALNFVASNTNKIIYHHAGPQTIVTGATLPDNPDFGPDKIMEIPDPEANVYNLEMQSNLEASMALMDTLRASFFAQARVVDLATVKDKLARVTNFGVRMIYSDMLDMIANKRQFYGNGLAEISRRALVLMGENADSIDDIFVDFEDPLPNDRLEMIQSLQIEQQVGILSRQTVAKDMNRDVAVELDNLEEEEGIEVLQDEPDEAGAGFMPGLNQGF